MGKTMRSSLLTLIFIPTFTFSAAAQCPAETSLFFANGMFNSKKSANDSLKNLKMRLSETANWNYSRSYLAYNENENAAYQLLEVYEQKNVASTSNAADFFF